MAGFSRTRNFKALGERRYDERDISRWIRNFAACSRSQRGHAFGMARARSPNFFRMKAMKILRGLMGNAKCASGRPSPLVIISVWSEVTAFAEAWRYQVSTIPRP